MFSETDLNSATSIKDAIRWFLTLLDWPAYALLQIMYQLFFSVASADLFGNETIMKFYGRVQVILGVFMMFQLSLTILKGIVNPDSFFGDKGSGKAIITKIITALLLLTVIMPISIPNPRNEYEIQINNNGLLFGTLYSLQHRILSANTIGRIVLGTNSSNSYSAEASSSDDTELKRASRIFTATILKGFYRINLLPEEDRPIDVDFGEDPAIYNDNRVCTDIDDSILDAYTKVDASPGDIIGSVNHTCIVDGSWLDHIPIVDDFRGNKRYAFVYMPIVSTIVAVIFVFILLSFCVDIGVRAIKLAILRLIAPIPIISYMDPNGSKDGAFNSWVKALTTTYIDLFIRLAIVYFVIFLIQSIMQNGIVMNRVDSLTAFFTHILIFIALFVFAKQAPKFIKEVLGMKGDTGKLFSGLGELKGFGAATLGSIGSGATGFRAAKEENDALHPGHTITNGFRNVGSAIASGISGGYTGMKTFMGKDGSASNVMQAQSQANARRAAHSTAIGRMESQAYGIFTGRGLSEKGNADLKLNQDAFKSFKDYKGVLETEALKKTNIFGESGGNYYNYQKLVAAVERARSSGQTTFDYDDGTNSYTGLRTDSFDVNTMDAIKSSQASSYARDLMSAAANPSTAVNRSFLNANGTAYNSYLMAKKASSELKQTSFDGTYGNTKKAMGETSSASTQFETDMRQVMRRANDQNKK